MDRRKEIKRYLFVLVTINVLIFSYFISRGNGMEESLYKQSPQIVRKIRTGSIIDPLTGAYNKEYLRQRLEEEIALAKHHKNPLSLLYIDMDDFKVFSDIRGKFTHSEGDEVLKAISNIIRSQITEVDILARWWGLDEFVIILPNKNANQAKKIAQQIRKTIQQTTIKTDKRKYDVTVSIGIAEYHKLGLAQRYFRTLKLLFTGIIGSPNLTPNVDELILRAEMALHISKKQGKNCVTVYSLEKLKRAIEKGFFNGP